MISEDSQCLCSHIVEELLDSFQCCSGLACGELRVLRGIGCLIVDVKLFVVIMRACKGISSHSSDHFVKCCLVLGSPLDWWTPLKKGLVAQRCEGLTVVCQK